MSFHSLNSLDDGIGNGSGFLNVGNNNTNLINFSFGGGSFGSNPLLNNNNDPNNSQKRSLVKIVDRIGGHNGELPYIPNRIRALARVIQNADSFQFPDLRDRETGDLNEEPVVRILKELGVTLSREEEWVFPIALRECKRTLWRASVYSQQQQYQNTLGMTSKKYDDSIAMQSIHKVLEICNAIDTEAAFAGAALGPIPEGVLTAYTMFARISSLDKAFATQKVLECLYERVIDPLKRIHQIIRDHNIYQTRRQAVFSEEEVRDVAIENERLNFVTKHLELILTAMEEGVHFSVSSLFDDKFIISIWTECFGDRVCAVPMDPEMISRRKRAMKTKQQQDQQQTQQQQNQNQNQNQSTSTSSPRKSATIPRIPTSEKEFETLLSSSNQDEENEAGDDNYYNKKYLDDEDRDNNERLRAFFHHFPYWSRKMLRCVLDYHGHGVLSVFAIQRALKIWGPSTILPFKVAVDLRKKRFLIGQTPKSAHRFIAQYHEKKRKEEAALNTVTTIGFQSSTSASFMEKSIRGGGDINKEKGSFILTLASVDPRDSLISLCVKTLKKQREIALRTFEMNKQDGVWQIAGITSANFLAGGGGLCGYESPHDAISSFNDLFETPIGTDIEDVNQVKAFKVVDDFFMSHVSTLSSDSKQNEPQQQGMGETTTSMTSVLDQQKEMAEKHQLLDREKENLLAPVNESPSRKQAQQEDLHPFGEIAEFADTSCLLHRAVYCCDIPLVRKLLSSGSEGVVNYPQADEVITGPDEYWTPLLFATCSPITRAAECVKLLTDRGADVTFQDSLGRTALFYAILNGHADAVQHLLRCNPKLQASDTSVYPILVAIGAHWLHPDINDIHSLSGVRISSDVINAILFNGCDHIATADLITVIHILEVKLNRMDLQYASNEDAANKEFKERPEHQQFWRKHSAMIRDSQRERIKTSIVAHGAFMRSEPGGAAEIFKSIRHVRNYLMFRSVRDVVKQISTTGTFSVYPPHHYQQYLSPITAGGVSLSKTGSRLSSNSQQSQSSPKEETTSSSRMSSPFTRSLPISGKS